MNNKLLLFISLCSALCGVPAIASMSQEVFFNEIRQHAGECGPIKWTGNDRAVSGSCVDGSVNIWDAKLQRCVCHFHKPEEGVEQKVVGLSADPSGTQLSVLYEKTGASQPDTAKVSDIAYLMKYGAFRKTAKSTAAHGNSTINRFSYRPDSGLLDRIKQHAGDDGIVGWDGGHRAAASFSKDGLLKVWETKYGGFCVFEERLKSLATSVLAWDDCLLGQRLATSHEDGSVIIWDTFAKTHIPVFFGGDGSEVQDLFWNSEGTRVAISYSNGRVCIMEVQDKKGLEVTVDGPASISHMKWGRYYPALMIDYADGTSKCVDLGDFPRVTKPNLPYSCCC